MSAGSGGYHWLTNSDAWSHRAGTPFTTTPAGTSFTTQALPPTVAPAPDGQPVEDHARDADEDVVLDDAVAGDRGQRVDADEVAEGRVVPDRHVEVEVDVATERDVGGQPRARAQMTDPSPIDTSNPRVTLGWTRSPA